MSITHESIPRKGKDAEDGGGAAAAGLTSPPAAPVPLPWRGGKDGAACERPPSYRGAAGFTPEELADMARADAEIDDAPDILTPEERALSRALDRQAAGEKRPSPPTASDRRSPSPEGKHKAGETPEQRAARLARKAAYRAAHREEERARSAHYNAAHRQERREYQRAYDAAHREEINARRRKRYAAKRAAGKRKEGNNGRKI